MNEHPAHGELRPVTEHASVLLANNPSPMTLEGTNSWVVRVRDGEVAAVELVAESGRTWATAEL